ncbi:entericidin A/B family lipoprotein [Roseospira visakhapatnamensis]|uniref:Putative small secreted protein n=1 Tax=Roseospira visakhapatnamensis TaxID=390880 RepID=A0A7W6RD60_9PROT|nr:entericidin A/B family lipoprotein [Roseospira visakhapatnamensis]MBB4265876.1 putative small secreted protein [Roseospira visakhapatnamensis]
MKTIVILMSMLGALAVAGCNTAEGFGEDVEDAGEAIQDSADG